MVSLQVAKRRIFSLTFLLRTVARVRTHAAVEVHLNVSAGGHVKELSTS